MIRVGLLRLSLGSILLLLGALGIGHLLPRGEQIAYMYAPFELEPDWDIYLYDVLRGVSINFISTPAQDRYPEWSPDGNMLAYHSNPRGFSLSGPFDVYIADVTTGESRLLQLSDTPGMEDYNQAMVAWSPEGERIAFHSGIGYVNEMPYRIVISDITGDNHETVPTVSLPGEIIYATWSPDGTRMAFVLSEPGTANSTLYVMNVGAKIGDPKSRPTPLYRSSDDILFPAWSPDGAQITFALSQEVLQQVGQAYVQAPSDNIFVINSSGEGLFQVTNSLPGVRNMHPDWTPDGQYIVYASDQDGDDYDLYRIRPDGTGQERLTNFPGDEWAPDWRP